jgi:enoyl-CoA hydratase
LTRARPNRIVVPKQRFDTRPIGENEMGDRVGYERRDSIAEIAMDDGKLNLLSPDMLAELAGAFDRAEADRAVVVLAGRPGVFSAGFDLGVLRGGAAPAARMVQMGFELAERILAFPSPVVIACTGHAIAMGAFLVLSGDYRIGALGAHRIGANEVAIGIRMPHFGVEICRQRLAPAHFSRAVALAEIYSPEDAVAAGFLDRTAPAESVADVARGIAGRLAQLDRDVHAASKLRARDHTLRAIRAAIEADASAAPA